MKLHYIHILLFTFIFSATAYSAPKMSSKHIQILEAPSKALDISNKYNIAIIANIYNDIRNDSLKKVNYPTDSLLAVNTALSLKATLEDSPVFTDYDFPVYNFKRDDSKTLRSGLSLDVATDLANDIDAEYLLTVDIVHTEIFYEIGFIPQDGSFVSYASTLAPYMYIFRYYDIKNNKILDNQLINDTLVIETTGDYNTNPKSLLSKITVGNDATFEACKQAGAEYANLIVPHWAEAIRYYFNDGSKNMKKAEEYVNNEQWTEAMNIWMNYTDYKNKKTAAMGCFNVAFACEMIGDFNLALDWLNLAKKKDATLGVDGYIELINKRIKDKSIIDKLLAQ